MSLDNTVVAFYGNATSCTKYRLAAIDWVAAQQAPDAAKWSGSLQSGTIVIDPSFATLPLVFRLDLATYPVGYIAAGWLGSRGY